MAERRWRLCGWEWGWEDAPYLCVESDDGENTTLYIGELYDDFDDDLACMTENPLEYVPEQWRQLMEESCDDCQRALGEPVDGERWHFKDGNNPCRWRPQCELDALYEHAKTHMLFGQPEYPSEYVNPSTAGCVDEE